MNIKCIATQVSLPYEVNYVKLRYVQFHIVAENLAYMDENGEHYHDIAMELPFEAIEHLKEDQVCWLRINELDGHTIETILYEVKNESNKDDKGKVYRFPDSGNLPTEE